MAQLVKSPQRKWASRQEEFQELEGGVYTPERLHLCSGILRGKKIGIGYSQVIYQQ